MNRLRKTGRFLFLAVQKALVPCCLFAAYVFGVGALAVPARVFHFLPRRGAKKDSFWKTGMQCDNDGKDASEQS